MALNRLARRRGPPECALAPGTRCESPACRLCPRTPRDPIYQYSRLPHAQAAVFTYEIPETKNAEGEWVPSGTTPHLEYGMREGRKITGRVLYFVRSNPKGVGEKTAEAGEPAAGSP